MDKQNRKAIIAGNWKMNKTATEAAELIDALIPAVKDASCEVVICVPFTDLVTAVAKTKGTNIHVGAENVHFEKSGAFTGEISADMLTDLGVEYVVVGHSERRQYFATRICETVKNYSSYVQQLAWNVMAETEKEETKK
jgi:triosephosphate isomerase